MEGIARQLASISVAVLSGICIAASLGRTTAVPADADSVVIVETPQAESPPDAVQPAVTGPDEAHLPEERRETPVQPRVQYASSLPAVRCSGGTCSTVRRGVLSRLFGRR